MPFLVTGLRSFQAHQLCMVSVGVVVDICAAVGVQIQPFCDQIVGALTDCLKDGSAHRDTKPVVFSCFGDVAMAIGVNFEPYLQVATMLLMQASQAQMQLDDDELVDLLQAADVYLTPYLTEAQITSGTRGYKTDWIDTATAAGLEGLDTLVVQDMFSSPAWER